MLRLRPGRVSCSRADFRLIHRLPGLARAPVAVAPRFAVALHRRRAAVFIDSDVDHDGIRDRNGLATALHLGIHSTLSVHVPTDTADVAASLNLYARQRLDQPDEQIRNAEGFAAQLAAAIESAETTDVQTNNHDPVPALA